MAIQIQLRQGTTTEHNSFTGAVGEVTVDTTKDVPVVHDGVTVGGHPVAAKANTDGTISLIKKDGTSAGIINSSGLFNNTLTSANVDQALTAGQGKVLNDKMFGVRQTWQNVTANRVWGTTYTNSTGKTIFIYVANRETSTVTNAVMEININDQQLFFNGGGAGSSGTYKTASAFLPIPHGATYSVDAFFDFWELR